MNLNFFFHQVTAKDSDTEASLTTYQILDGNVGNKFRIEEQTGFIKVARPLDYEDRKEYTLKVHAWDGTFGNETLVKIKVTNVNDLPPKFNKDKYTVTQIEETLPNYPILQGIVLPPFGNDTANAHRQGFFSCKTENPRSEFWKTQLANFSKKPSLKFVQNPRFAEIFLRNQ